MQRESVFQKNLVKELKQLFKGCVVMKTDANHTQGIPDLLILYKDKWAALECKRSEKVRNSKNGLQQNQEYYVDIWNKMSFARFIYPENKKEVLDELQQAFKS